MIDSLSFNSLSQCFCILQFGRVGSEPIEKKVNLALCGIQETSYINRQAGVQGTSHRCVYHTHGTQEDPFTRGSFEASVLDIARTCFVPAQAS
jgi:hypothetical protein